MGALLCGSGEDRDGGDGAGGIGAEAAATVSQDCWRCDEVIAGLFIGGSAAGKAAMSADRRGEALRFSTILNVSDKVFYPPGRGAVRTHHEPMDDYGGTELTPDLLGRCFDTIDEGLAANPPRSLVHCTLGVNRSAIIVGAWLMARRGLEADAALAVVKGCRRRVGPVDDYVAALRALDVAALSLATEPPRT
mmetsp:Transcript_30590/g.91694  ORF Transcript_30590/g.91694 Transcript_30590/m.91694 type:complete len:192 (+) Transcript_30590:91-666(+)